FASRAIIFAISVIIIKLVMSTFTSSFKKKASQSVSGTINSSKLPPGTRGGIPVGTILLIKEDRYTGFSKLLLKYYLSQGIVSGHDILFTSAEENPESFIKGLPWITNDDELDKLNDGGVGYDDNERSNEGEEKMTIAWRYKKLKKFESGINKKPFCQSFDLTKSIPQSAIDSASMTLIDSCTWDNEYKNPFNKLLSMIRKVVDKNFRSVVSTQGIEQRNILRIGIHSIASPSWQSNSPQDIFIFFHALRSLLRFSYSSAVITIPAYLYGSFIRRIEHISDAVIELESFAGSSATVNSAYSAEYHGLFHVHKLPSINSLIPPSIKLSILAGNGTENNLGFKLRRKKFSIETFHLPPEGGINERRTDSKEKNAVIKSSEKIAI
ncbi:6761_t:CDS:2, partial [Diversispora eburnea]